MLPPYAPDQHQPKTPGWQTQPRPDPNAPRPAEFPSTTAATAAAMPVDPVGFLTKLASLSAKSRGRLPYPGTISLRTMGSFSELLRVDLVFWQNDGVTLDAAQLWLEVFGMEPMKQQKPPYHDQWVHHGHGPHEYIVNPEITVSWIAKPTLDGES